VADGTGDEALREMCDKLLANTVIENYRIEKLSGDKLGMSGEVA
jgi:phosphoribosylformylglycinamidine synthase